MPRGMLSKHVICQSWRDNQSAFFLVLSLPAMNVNGSPNPPKHPRELGHNILSYFPMVQCKSCKSNSPPFPTLPMALTIYDLKKQQRLCWGKMTSSGKLCHLHVGILKNPYLQFGSYIFKMLHFSSITGGIPFKSCYAPWLQVHQCLAPCQPLALPDPPARRSFKAIEILRWNWYAICLREICSWFVDDFCSLLRS